MSKTSAEPAERAFERAILGLDWIQDLAQETKRLLYDQERRHGKIDDRLARAAAVNVARACSLIAWRAIERAGGGIP
jgi:hypothetical protein